MLEGRELEKQLGEYGSAFVDINDQLVVEVGLSAKVDLIAELRKLAAKTDNSLDDKTVDIVAALIAKKPA